MRRLFVDTGAWFAAADPSDRRHVEVAGLLQGFSGRLVTSSYVDDETITLALVRRGHDAACRLGRVILEGGEVDLVQVTIDDQHAAWDLFQRRRDQRYSFTDCTSFALMRRLAITDAASLDRHFVSEGFSVCPPLPQ